MTAAHVQRVPGARPGAPAAAGILCPIDQALSAQEVVQETKGGEKKPTHQTCVEGWAGKGALGLPEVLPGWAAGRVGTQLCPEEPPPCRALQSDAHLLSPAAAAHIASGPRGCWKALQNLIFQRLRKRKANKTSQVDILRGVKNPEGLYARLGDLTNDFNAQSWQ